MTNGNLHCCNELTHTRTDRQTEKEREAKRKKPAQNKDANIFVI